jgi:hypothetical protein
MKHWIVCVVLGSALAVAVSAGSAKDRLKVLDKANFIAYQGQQQSWPVGIQTVPSTVETKYGVTIYRSLPGRPYEILGLIQVGPGGKVVRHAADAALAAGANAILVCPDDAFVKAGITVQPKLVMEGDKASGITSLTGLLIRWSLASSTASAPATNKPAVPPAPSP